MLNNITIIGRLTSDPELRTTTTGISVCSFTLAVDRDFSDKSTGERQTDFINCVAWRQTADFVSRWFGKGRLMVVQGILQIRHYEDKNGNRRVAWEVQADKVHFSESKKDSQDVGEAVHSNQAALSGLTGEPEPDDNFSPMYNSDLPW